MQFYKKEKDRLVCLLCSYYCKLKVGQTGVCGVNKNIGEKVDCLVYGYLSALNIDPIEKKPLYHFLPNTSSLSLGTVGCNFRCSFCQNWQISQTSNINKNNYFTVDEIVNMARNKNCKSISYTYNEPTIFYPFAKDIAIKAKEFDIKSVFVSNGFESSEVIDDMKGIIDAFNIDLKSFDKNYYKKSLGGDLKIVCDNLIKIKKNNIHLEITTLIVPSINDSKEELENIVKFIKENLGLDTVWHISAFHPDYKELNLQRTKNESLKMAFDIAKSHGLNYVYMGNSDFKNDTKCKNCGEVLIRREYFQVIENKIRNSSCFKCKTKVDGVFI
ncbi:MAG: AmmeMemoRadiSam system radical SAM enzyme [Aliarcobacter sp.]|nr:AmmeMemoRadiSam system radical SAM enzyme [Aliarcobacter sp.]